MRLFGFRRGPRPRSADDDDWGTSSPAAIMDPPEIPPSHSSNFNFSEAVSRLQQQELKSYTCTFSPRCIVSLYFAVAFVFIPIGAAVLAASSSIRSTGGRIRYDNCTTDPRDNCFMSFNISRQIDPPSYLYYSLTNFHQNARTYAKSRSDIMNQGRLPTTQLEVETCEPSLFRDDITRGTSFNASEFIYPCGLTARSFFNDTFELCKDPSCTDLVSMKKDGIAWWTDATHKFNEGSEPQFKERSKVSINGRSANELLDDDDFVVWMRLSAFPNFDKLYRVIDEPIPPGQYFIRIKNVFPVAGFNGTKSFIITTTAWTGGPNPFLGTVYVVIGVIALFIAVTLLFKHLLNPRPTSSRDPAILLREHLEKYVLDTDSPSS